jgi:hypothetical protein
MFLHDQDPQETLVALRRAQHQDNRKSLCVSVPVKPTSVTVSETTYRQRGAISWPPSKK